MAELLTYALVDSMVQNRMSNQAPSSTRRLEVYNALMQKLRTMYNLETTRRFVTVSGITNGETEYAVNTIITAADVDRFLAVRYPVANDGDEPEWRYVTLDDFRLHLGQAITENEFTDYYKDGVRYMRFNSRDNSSTAVSLEIEYATFYNGLNGATLVEEVAGTVDYKFLLPKRFVKLFVSGSLIDLWPMALGADGDREVAKAMAEYSEQLQKLGLDDMGTKPKTKARKIKIRPLW